MQTQIHNKQALGVNGVISKAETQYLATIQGVLMQDTQIGSAVAFGTNENELINTGITADNFVGFVVRDGFINSCETPTQTYKKGDTATIITKGSLFITAPADATQGQYVNVAANGAITFGDTSAATSYGWRVATGGASGEVIEITTTLKQELKNENY